jgi:hypothetical protein
MIKSILTHIGGIENFGLVSLCLFFVFFTGMLIWAFTLKKPYLKRMAGAPIEPSEDKANSDHSHE